MEILLIAAIAVVAVAALYVAATFDLRARQSTAPLLEEAVRKMSDQLRAAEESMRRQLRALADDLQRDREQQRLDGRKIQGRLDHADSRVVSVANQFLADLDAIKRRTDQAVAQQDQLAAGLRYLDQRVARLSEALGHSTAPPAPSVPSDPSVPFTPLAPTATLVTPVAPVAPAAPGRATVPRPAGPALAVSGPPPPAQTPEPSPGDQAPRIAAAPVPTRPVPTRPVTVREPLPQPRSPEAESPEPEPPDRPAHPGWPGLGPR
jgi:hypothetical protein